MKKLNLLIAVLTIVIVHGCTTNTNTRQEDNTTSLSPYGTLGSIEIFDNRLLSLLGENAKIEILANGFDWVEGPVWISEGQFLVFSDVKTNKTFKWKEGDSTTVYLTPSGYTGETPREGEKGSNGLILNGNGQLLICQHGNRQVALMNASVLEPNPEFIPLADNFEGKKFNSPNDLVVHSSGDIFFTDPPYGLEQQMNDPAKEIDFQGVYRWSVIDSTVSLVTSEMTRPNGVVLSPDESKLYVANSDPLMAIWNVYDLAKDGSVSEGRLLYDATPVAKDQPGLPDGMVVHKSGLLFATGPGGVWVFDDEGTNLGKIQTNVPTANCTFDDDFKTLYITADSYILRVRMNG